MQHRVLPNAEHSCVGHFTSIFFDARAFYYSLLLVSTPTDSCFRILFVNFSQNVPRPSFKWSMESVSISTPDILLGNYESQRLQMFCPLSENYSPTPQDFFSSNDSWERGGFIMFSDVETFPLLPLTCISTRMFTAVIMVVHTSYILLYACVQSTTGGSITLSVDTKPTEVLMFRATTLQDKR